MALFTREHTVESDLIYTGNIINLRVDKLKLSDGKLATRELVEHNGGVVIACMPKADQVVIIRQYRYSVDEDLLELPAGRIERGEDPLPAAKRELTEETGYRAENWSELSRMYTAPGFCNEMLYMYLATEVEFVGKSLDEDEETEVIELSVADAWKLVHEGKIRDAKTAAGLSMLYAMLKV